MNKLTVEEIHETRCTMCALPTKVKNGIPARYCGGYQCSNRVRLCQLCGDEFITHMNGARGKYCATCTPIKDSHNPLLRALALGYEVCDVCSVPGDRSVRARASSWPYVCAPCRTPLRHVEKRLHDHHVPWALVKPLLIDGSCPICKSEMLLPVIGSNPGTSHRARAQLVVDHDHKCCAESSKSCGECVRGLICHKCNAALGLLNENVDAINRLAKYMVAIEE